MSQHNHPGKTMLTSIVNMLKNRTQTTTMNKVRAHTGITGNENANKLALAAHEQIQTPPIHDYVHAHTTPYYFQKDHWPSQTLTPYK